MLTIYLSPLILIYLSINSFNRSFQPIQHTHVNLLGHGKSNHALSLPIDTATETSLEVEIASMVGFGQGKQQKKVH